MPEKPPKEEGREPVPTAAPPEQEEEMVQLTGKVPKSLRNRVKMAAIALDMSSQDVQRLAVEEFLDRHNL